MDKTVELPDMQKTKDIRGIVIPRVGITRVALPVRLKRKPTIVEFAQEDLALADGTDVCFHGDTLKHEHCESVAEFEASVTLPADQKGTHMSRFSEVLMSTLSENQHFISVDDLYSIVTMLRMMLQAESADIVMHFTYFVEQKAPVSGRIGMAPMDITLQVSITPESEFVVTSAVLGGMTTCPCSREISDFDHETGKGKGAHSQRGTVSVSIVHSTSKMIWFEDLFALLSEAFSCPVYPVLKRPDERAVTIRSYENPKFVEDVVRDVATAIEQKVLDDQCFEYSVRVQNMESIHYHDAFAEVKGYVKSAN